MAFKITENELFKKNNKINKKNKIKDFKKSKNSFKYNQSLVLSLFISASSFSFFEA